MFSIYIGYDKDEIPAYHVLSHSIIRRASSPVSITPLARSHFTRFFTRARGPMDSTDFSVSRFLVPYLSRYQGWSLYLDCDMLCQTDITELWSELPLEPTQAVWVCPHRYQPKTERKMQGQVQTVYPYKNWSSLMFFRNSQCRMLTPEYVNTAPGLDLHQFAWLSHEQIGFLPLEWNWLVGEYDPNPAAKILHYTLGGPWWRDYVKQDHAHAWLAEYYEMTGQHFWSSQVWQPA